MLVGPLTYKQFVREDIFLGREGKDVGRLQGGRDLAVFEAERGRDFLRQAALRQLCEHGVEQLFGLAVADGSDGPDAREKEHPFEQGVEGCF